MPTSFTYAKKCPVADKPAGVEGLQFIDHYLVWFEIVEGQREYSWKRFFLSRHLRGFSAADMTGCWTTDR